MNTVKKILADLNKRIDESSYSRYEIAKLSGLSKGILSSIQNNPNYDPRISTLLKIEAVINIVSKQIISDIAVYKFKNIDMNIYRKSAIAWWSNDLDKKEKQDFTDAYYGGRKWNSLTGREIESIWKIETII